MKSVTRYHPLMVTLHWLIALLLSVELAIGFFKLTAIANSDPSKIAALRVHMAAGMLIPALMIVRLAVRSWTPRPPSATPGHQAVNRVATAAHLGFYLLIFLMAGSGLATAVISGINQVVFGPSGGSLPASLLIYPTRVAHGYIGAVLALLIAVHVGAVLYHQLGRQDGLLGRMTFGPRT